MLTRSNKRILISDESRFKLFQIMERLAEIDKGFTFAICKDKENRATGVVWMNSIMRSNFIRFGSFLSIDAMKRETNYNGWSYISPVVINDVNKICVVCEALMISEDNDAYHFVISSLFQMCP